MQQTTYYKISSWKITNFVIIAINCDLGNIVSIIAGVALPVSISGFSKELKELL